MGLERTLNKMATVLLRRENTEAWTHRKKVS